MTTLRWRLTALYGTLFFAAGVAMLTIVYVVLSRRIPRVPRIPVGGVAVRREVRQLLLAELTNQRDRALHELLIGSLIALAIVTVVAGVLGWAVAGRALRPVRDITATAQRLSTHNLDERINLDGPPDELKELADTFDAMLDRLSSAFDAQRQFVRTPRTSCGHRSPCSAPRSTWHWTTRNPPSTSCALWRCGCATPPTETST